MSFSFSSVPLKPGEEIRILRLALKAPRLRGFRRLLHVPCPSWKVPRADRLHGELVAISLAHPPEYTALSYTWGDPTFDSEIIVNGRRLPITSSLEAALRTLQGSADDAEYLSLWIDQICINQNDTNDKSVQVPLMKQIYASATQTIAWLGPATDDSDLVMDYLNVIGLEGAKVGLQDPSSDNFKVIVARAATDPGWLNTSPASSCPPDPPTTDTVIRKLILAHGDGEESRFVLPRFGPFFGRQYFYRGWIKQEVAIPSRLVFQCGSKTIDVEIFKIAVNFHTLHCLIRQLNDSIAAKKRKPDVAELLADRDVMTNVIMPLVSIRNLYHTPETREVQTLSYLIDKYRSRPKFTQHIDRIYGLLGLASDFDALGIEIDYNKPWEEVYTDAFQRIIRNGEGGNGNGQIDDVLSMVVYPKSTDSLPSWVPDLNVTARVKFLRDITLNTTRPFAAAGSTLHRTPSPSGNTGPGKLVNILACHGVIVDSIRQVGARWELEEGEEEPGALPSPLGAHLPWSDIAKYIESTPMATNHPHATLPGRRAEGAWRIPVVDHEHDEIGGAKRATSASRRAYNKAKNLIQWAHALSLGQAIADVVPLTNEQENELKRVSENNRKGKAQQMRRDRLTPSADTAMYFARMVAMFYRRPFAGERGFVGLGPSELQVGDVVCVLHGARVPFVLRPCQDGEGKQYSLVGECYCDGIMDGEALKMGLEEDEFRIT
ncbi:hypothetical protein EYR36_002955 [Pleurotus pulmonarius]|nr:hypothetical protein EYR36_002955 [Pleurotus pulmonarius]